MKNYALTDEDREKFILGYSVDKTDLYVFYGNGEYELLINNKNNINTILAKMKEQVENNEYFIKVCYDNYSEAFNYFFGSLIFLIGNIIVFVSGDLTQFQFASTLGALGMSIYSAKDFTILRSLLLDAIKHRIFLENENLINENIKKVHEKLRLTNTTKEIITNTLENEEVFNYNNIGEVSYVELSNILDAIDELNNTNDDSESKLTRKKQDK